MNEDTTFTVDDARLCIGQMGAIIQNLHERIAVLEGVVTHLAMLTVDGKKITTVMEFEKRRNQEGRNDPLPPLKKRH